MLRIAAAICLSLFSIAAHADCLMIDLFGCKAKVKAEQDARELEQQREARYLKNVENAMKYKTGDFIYFSANGREQWSVTSKDSSCKPSPDADENEVMRCNGEVDRRYQLFKAPLISGARPAANCKESAISKKDDLDSVTMVVKDNVLKLSNDFIAFRGRIERSEEGLLLLFSAQDGSYEMVRINAGTVLMNSGSFGVDEELRGYGKQVATKTISVPNEGTKTVPVIGAICVE